jgi:hypothetical protein
VPLNSRARASDSPTRVRSGRGHPGATPVVSHDHETPPRLPRKHFELTIRIDSYPRHGRWYAEATDLALMAEGASEAEAIHCLIEQVIAYVRTALSRGWIDQLRRRASLRHRLAVRVRVAFAQLLRQPAITQNKLVRI